MRRRRHRWGYAQDQGNRREIRKIDADAPLLGAVRVHDLDDDEKSVPGAEYWETTTDLADLSRPVTDVVVGSTIEEIRQALEARYPPNWQTTSGKISRIIGYESDGRTYRNGEPLYRYQNKAGAIKEKYWRVVPYPRIRDASNDDILLAVRTLGKVYLPASEVDDEIRQWLDVRITPVGGDASLLSYAIGSGRQRIAAIKSGATRSDRSQKRHEAVMKLRKQMIEFRDKVIDLIESTARTGDLPFKPWELNCHADSASYRRDNSGYAARQFSSILALGVAVVGWPRIRRLNAYWSLRDAMIAAPTDVEPDEWAATSLLVDRLKADRKRQQQKPPQIRIPEPLWGCRSCGVTGPSRYFRADITGVGHRIYNGTCPQCLHTAEEIDFEAETQHRERMAELAAERESHRRRWENTATTYDEDERDGDCGDTDSDDGDVDGVGTSGAEVSLAHSGGVGA
jgi:siroheme synthase (precorrin-2 oxidase/ferrochelatase)